MHEFDVTFMLRSKPNISYLLDGVIEYGGISIETRDGKIYGKTTISIEKDDHHLAREKAIEELEKLASMLTVIFGEGFIIEDVKVAHKPIIEDRGKVKEIAIFDTLEVKASLEIYSKKSLDEIKAELKELTDRINKLGESKALLRAIKWWGKGDLEEDKVDKFLDYFISFEMLASIKGYKSKYKEWARKFSNDYSITHKPDGKTAVNTIRNNILHKPGPEKEEAEKLANQYADSFGKEILKAIKRIIEESTSI
jgi:hypothetical protein